MFMKTKGTHTTTTHICENEKKQESNVTFIIYRLYSLSGDDGGAVCVSTSWARPLPKHTHTHTHTEMSRAALPRQMVRVQDRSESPSPGTWEATLQSERSHAALCSEPYRQQSKPGCNQKFNQRNHTCRQTVVRSL